MVELLEKEIQLLHNLIDKTEKMKFGRQEAYDEKDIFLPSEHVETIRVLNQGKKKKKLNIRIGLPKWGKADLENFYPKGCKNPLQYYSSQFNAIEFNAFFYRIFKPEQVVKWRDNTSEDFKFFPKVPQIISQFRRLKEVDHLVDEFILSIIQFKEKLGGVFLQMHPSFSPENFEHLERFIKNWPSEIPLSIELRHDEWFNNKQVSEKLYTLLETNQVSNIITDTVGRRDLMHMRLTSSTAFVRFTGANAPIDIKRVEDWVNRIIEWRKAGLNEILFFAHIHAEKESAYIPAMFIEQLNERLSTNVHIPKVL